MPQSHDGVVYDGHGVLAFRLPVVRDVQLLEPAIQPKRVAQVLTPSRIKNKLAELGEQVHAAVAALEVTPLWLAHLGGGRVLMKKLMSCMGTSAGGAW